MSAKIDLPVHLARAYLEPGPVVLVSSAYAGTRNVMTCGWHMVMEFSPSLIACMIAGGNHSFEMIRRSGECVVNLPTADMIDTVVAIGNCSGRDGDKFERLGIATEDAAKVGAPLLSECFGNFECRVSDDFGVDRYNLFVLEIVKARIARRPKHPTTLHYTGDGVFVQSGKVVSRRAGFRPGMLGDGALTGERVMDGRALKSLVTAEGQLRLSLEPIEIAEPGRGEVVVRIEAAPLNPSDIALMFGSADIATLRREGEALVAEVPAERLAGLKGRLGQKLALGGEGAGTVVAAGAGAEHLLGRTVALSGGGTYASLRTAKSGDVIPLPDGATVAEGAALFVNPLTALGFVGTMRAEGHKAIVHTAAASNLGQMLAKICVADGIPLVAVVRSEAQAELLRGLGVEHVVDQSAADFDDRLVDAIAATGATIAFDAVGGGTLASRILVAMEAVAARGMATYTRYGSNALKQVYIYGTLDPGPTVLDRIGYSWRLDGWLVSNFLAKARPAAAAEMRARIAAEYRTTFASGFTATIGLDEALRPEMARAYERKATGSKYLIDPQR